jgi:Plasmid encoded RepA protein
MGKLVHAGEALKQLTGDVVISKRKEKRLEAIEMVRVARSNGGQTIGFSSRPFVLCGLPIRRPKKDVLVHVRRNGKFFLRVAGDPEFGLPFGQDRLIPLWVATVALRMNTREVRFNSAAQILDTFNLAKDGKTYRRLIQAFQRVFASTIFFGTEEQLKAAAIWDWSRFHFFDRARLWYSREVEQQTLPDDQFVNLIVLSAEFWKELQEHPIPVDLDVVTGLSDSPGALDFYMWMCWRCWTAPKEQAVPLFGPGGLVQQLGVQGYAERWKFRQTIRRWLLVTREWWPECPARLSTDGGALLLTHAEGIRPL